MIKAIRNIGIFVIVVLLSVASINYSVDPINMYHNGIEEEQVASMNLNGDSAYCYYNEISDKKIQDYYVKQVEVDTLVIGSSRGMMLDANVIGDENLYNTCFSGAKISQMIAVLSNYYSYHGSLPDNVIVEISPWNFNGNLEKNTDYDYLCANGQEYLGIAQLDFSSILSFQMCQDSLTLLFSEGNSLNGGKKQKVFETKEDSNMFTEFSDGSLAYSDSYTQASDSVIYERIKNGIYDTDGYFYRFMNGFNEIDENSSVLFTKMINWLKEHNVKTTIYLSPFPPTAYDYALESEYNIVKDIEQYIYDMSKIYGYSIHGSYNPYNIGLSNREFYDSFHLKKELTIAVWNYVQ